MTGVAKGSTTLSASAAGLNAASVPVAVTSKAELVFSESVVTVGKGLETWFSEVSVHLRTDGSPYSPNQALTVNLSSSDSTKASVPLSVTIPAGQSSEYFYVRGVDLTSGTPVTVDAIAMGYNAPVTKLAANVVVPLASSNDREGGVQPKQVVFTPQNWFTFQNISVKGVDDCTRDGNQKYWVSIGNARSLDPNFIGVSAASVLIINTDNGAATGTCAPQ